MTPILILMAVGIVIGTVAPYNAPRYVQSATVTPTPTSAPQALPGATSGQVLASWYGVHEYCDLYNPKCIMANGEKLNDDDFTAACDKRWNLGDMVAVSYNGKTVIVECTDRGNFAKYGRSLDLSKAAFSALAPLTTGVIEVSITL